MPHLLLTLMGLSRSWGLSPFSPRGFHCVDVHGPDARGPVPFSPCPPQDTGKGTRPPPEKIAKLQTQG
jgi:hypothetical protein